MTYKDIPTSSQLIKRIHALESENVPPEASPQALVQLIVSIVQKNKLVLAAFTLAGLLLAAYYAMSLPPVYRATASILLEPDRTISIDGRSSFNKDLSLNRVDSELVVIRSERLLSEVFDTLEHHSSLEPTKPQANPVARIVSEAKNAIAGAVRFVAGDTSAEHAQDAGSTIPKKTGASPERLTAFYRFVNQVNAERVGQSYVISVTFSSSDPEIAARVANSIVSAYLLQTVQAEYETLLTGAGTLQGRLDALSEQMEASRKAMLAGVVPDASIPDANARVIGEALVPLSPSAPRKTLITAFGATLGLILGICLAALRYALDKRIWNEKDLHRRVGTPCLGLVSLPRSLRSRKKLTPQSVADFVAQNPDSIFSSALRNIRTTTDLLCAPFVKRRNAVVALVSWEESAAATAVGLGLAELNRQSGYRTTLIDSGSGRRKPSQTRNDKDLQAAFADAVADPLVLDETTLADIPDMFVMPMHSRRPETNLHVDFAGKNSRDLIENLVGRGTMLMALPPLSRSVDGLSLAAQADAVIIVATGGRTTLDNIQDAERLLKRIDANLVGTVIVKGKL